MNILPFNGDFPSFLLVNYRNLNCFIFLTWLLQRKRSDWNVWASNVLLVFCKNILDNKNIEAKCPITICWVFQDIFLHVDEL